jgi:hypothetical protein
MGKLGPQQMLCFRPEIQTGRIAFIRSVCSDITENHLDEFSLAFAEQVAPMSLSNTFLSAARSGSKLVGLFCSTRFTTSFLDSSTSFHFSTIANASSIHFTSSPYSSASSYTNEVLYNPSAPLAPASRTLNRITGAHLLNSGISNAQAVHPLDQTLSNGFFQSSVVHSIQMVQQGQHELITSHHFYLLARSQNVVSM